MHDFNSPCLLTQSPVASTIGQLLSTANGWDGGSRFLIPCGTEEA